MISNKQTEAIYVESSTNLTISGCTFSSSNTDFLYTTTSTAWIKNSIFVGDPLVSRRGLRFSYTTMVINNSSFVGFLSDSTDLVGAGVYSLSSDTSIIKCMF